MSLAPAIENAAAARDTSPAGVLETYRADLETLLPDHIDAGAWVRGAVSRIRTNKALSAAAAKDLGAFMAAVSDAARLGLTPATDEYWLTVRKGVIAGTVGYVGLIELMYRSGRVSAVHAEVVHENDRFTYRPGLDERPTLEVDWTGDRGEIVLAYAYAVMSDGATSRVAIADRARIDRALKASDGASSSYSPWKNDPAKMWLKTAVRDLAKWVPTSVTRAADATAPAAPTAAIIDTATGEVIGE